MNSAKTFTLGKGKKGIKIAPGHCVAVTAHETIDFRRETVHKIFPDHDLHGLLSPTTDLSREGIVAPTTQIDAGYNGTLNWTLTNTSNEERRFTHRERIFRLTIFKLAEGETPERLYDGDYQGETGYVRSQRKGAPVGMRDDEWEDSATKGGPEELLENLLRAGYPWHALGQRLKTIDGQFKNVTAEYAEIRDSLDRLTGEVDKVTRSQENSVKSLPETIRSVVSEEADSIKNRWLIGTGLLLLALASLVLSVTANEPVFRFVRNYGSCIGLLVFIGCIVTWVAVSRRPKKPRQ
ncbi:hypothetical protein JW916_03995 [Candidatus Sumerlaeota bacterium]|nr:hypothetical protein [Candidatus Sumerlaeota bacterium]